MQTPDRQQREQAEQLLAAARQAGDRRREVLALTDLGVVYTRGGDPRQAVVHLESALAIVRQFPDRPRESDVLRNLGMAVLSTGDVRRGLELLQHSLALARQTGDRFEEKLTLDRLGKAYSGLREFPRAVAFFEQSLALAREVADRLHEADLLWYLAIEHAEHGERERAVAWGQAAIDLLAGMGKPQAGWLANHLQTYRAGDAAARLSAAPGSLFGGGGWALQPGLPSAPAAGGPGLLRMALSAVKSMAKFLESGFKPVPPQTRQKRLQTCASCEHHTGMRCKLCGCFTAAKSWLPHEDCPIGKWPAQ